MVYIGITGNQHNLMATIKGSKQPVASGQSINLGGSTTSTSNTNTNTNNTNTSGSGDVAV